MNKSTKANLSIIVLAVLLLLIIIVAFITGTIVGFNTAIHSRLGG